jgi:hypothetical protein
VRNSAPLPKEKGKNDKANNVRAHTISKIKRKKK